MTLRQKPTRMQLDSLNTIETRNRKSVPYLLLKAELIQTEIRLPGYI